MSDELIGRANEIIGRCRKLAGFSEDATGTRRTSFSEPMREVHEEIRRWLEALGVTPKVDAAGNLRAVYEGTGSAGGRLMIGSHLDTVPNAGAFDGILGVALGVSLLESLGGRRLPFAIELVGFSDEEGIRFGTPFIGSRALVGRFDEQLLEVRDICGISLRQAIRNFGLDDRLIPEAKMRDEVLGYLEFHIEQGPVLDELRLPLGVVEAIVGQSRLEFEFFGRTNHAGTTPMRLRRDALAAAAEWIVAVEKEGKGAEGLVATVGLVNTKQGATNVIAGEVRASLDVRHVSDTIRARAVKNLLREAEEIAGRRGLSVQSSTKFDQHAVTLDPLLAGQVEEAIRKAGCKPHRMASGAGHDAMILAEIVPAAMMFLRSPGGTSHDPAESVDVEDVAKALEAGLHLVEQLGSSAAFRRGAGRA